MQKTIHFMATIRKKTLWVSPDEQLKALGWNWMLEVDTMRYITEDLILISPDEADAYYEAVNELYEMYIAAGEYVLENNLWDKMNIPENLQEMIRLTWEEDRHLHLYGRFDLAGGLNGEPIKLIEFNSDTATCIPETAIMQWAQLKANGLEDAKQFNYLYEALVNNFKTLLVLNPNLHPSLLISGFEGFPEDDTNLSVLGEAAKEAGFEVAYQNIDEVEFSETDGIFRKEKNGTFKRFDFWFKLVPWEFIAYEEPELMAILTSLLRNKRVMILNPAYNILFQSKYILKILWDLYPNHPLLLETSDKPLSHKPFYVEKVLFGREGANVKIYDQNHKLIMGKEGDYDEYAKIYQDFVEFLQDDMGNFYQAGVFFAYEGCAIGFRRGERIISNTAQFTGHIVEE